MQREKKIIKVSIFGIIVNIILVAFKATIGLIVNSIAIILDALNNLTDALSSLITIIGTKLANKAPDKKHPYGYGRIEYFTSVIIAALVLFAGVSALKESIIKIFNPADTSYSLISLIIVAVAVVVKYVFGGYVKKEGKKLNSSSLVASGQDAFMDAILSFSTLIAAIINYVFNLQLEGYLGVIIAIVIIKSAIDIFKETIDAMIGQRADKELTAQIKKRICSYKEVQGAYDLSLHNYGPSKIIATVHIQIPDDMSAQEIHSLTRHITVDIFNEFGIIITVGIYAANDTKEYKKIKEDVTSEIKKYKEIQQVHGLYIDDKTNSVFFDLIFDFKTKNIEDIKENIINNLTKKHKEYIFNIIVDADISD